MFCRLRSVAVLAHHIKINEPSVRIIIKREKKICEAITKATPAGIKNLHILQNIFLSCIENIAFTCVLDCYKKGIVFVVVV